jgi:peroxiredoxin
MGHIQDIYPELEKRGARAVTILAQNPLRIQDFLKDHSYPFPILADAERKVVKDYGVYVRANFESVNIARPANFVLAADGTVKYIHIASIQTEYPQDSDILGAFDAM